MLEAYVSYYFCPSCFCPQVTAGGFATILFKPAGPLKLEAAMKVCIRSMSNSNILRPSNQSIRRISSRSHSPVRSAHHRSPSEPFDLLSSPHSSSSVSSPGISRTISTKNTIQDELAVSPVSLGAGSVASGAYQLSPARCKLSSLVFARHNTIRYFILIYFSVSNLP